MTARLRMEAHRTQESVNTAWCAVEMNSANRKTCVPRGRYWGGLGLNHYGFRVARSVP